MAKKRDDGLYQKNIFIGIDNDTGKRKFKTVYGKSNAEIKRKSSAIIDSVEKRTYADDKGMTFGDWSKKWFMIYKSNLAQNTQRNYKYALERMGRVNEMKLMDLKKSDIMELLAEQNGHYETQRIMKMTINQILEAAIDDGFIYKNVCRTVKLVKPVEKSEKRILTEDEKKAIKKCNFTPMENMFIEIISLTGIRRGEALALMRNDFDLRSGTLSVSRSLEFIDNNTPSIKTPKSQSSIRTIPLPDSLSESLKAYFRRLAGLYLFHSTKGELMSQGAYKRFWDKIIKKINTAMGGDSKISLTTGLSAHTFRHNYATMLYYSGIDVKEAQKLLGHASVKITLELYTHLADNDKKVEEKIKKLVL